MAEKLQLSKKDRLSVEMCIRDRLYIPQLSFFASYNSSKSNSISSKQSNS